MRGKPSKTIKLWIMLTAGLFHIIAGIGTFAYFTNDNFRNSISAIFANSSWMYVGAVDLSIKGWLHYNNGIVKRHFYASQWRSGRPITKNVLDSIAGHIVSHDSGQLIVRHNAPLDSPATTNFMDAPQIGNSLKGQCYIVNRIVLQPLNQRADGKYAVWMNAKKLSCV